jgi:hypothetical protein
MTNPSAGLGARSCKQLLFLGMGGGTDIIAQCFHQVEHSRWVLVPTGAWLEIRIRVVTVRCSPDAGVSRRNPSVVCLKGALRAIEWP